MFTTVLKKDGGSISLTKYKGHLKTNYELVKFSIITNDDAQSYFYYLKYNSYFIYN